MRRADLRAEWTWGGFERIGYPMVTAELPHTEVVSGGRTVARCFVDPAARAERTAGVQLVIAHGHLAAAVRDEIIDRALECAGQARAGQLRVAVPLGDELVALFHERCPHARIRAAGATCLIDIDLS